MAGVGGRWDLFLWLALGAFAMRSAGCVYNDIVDRELDRQVERTRLRPLRQRPGVGAVAHGLLIALLCADRPGRPAPAQPHRARSSRSPASLPSPPIPS